MPLAYAYPDAYLAKFITPDREDRALAMVNQLATDAEVEFSAAWLQRLTITQAYVIACLENQASAEDLFSTKLKAYRQQLSDETTQAIAAARALAEVPNNIGFMSVPLERA